MRLLTMVVVALLFLALHQTAAQASAGADESDPLTTLQKKHDRSVEQAKNRLGEAWTEEVQASIDTRWEEFLSLHRDPPEAVEPVEIFGGLPEVDHYQQYLGVYSCRLGDQPDAETQFLVEVIQDADGRYFLKGIDGRTLPLAPVNGAMEFMFGEVVVPEGEQLEHNPQPFLAAARFARVDGRYLLRTWPDNGWDREVRHVMFREDDRASAR